MAVNTNKGLQVWCPFTKDLRNQGLSGTAVTTSASIQTTGGKIGAGCLYSNVQTVQYNWGVGKPNANQSIALWIKTSIGSNKYNAYFIRADGTGSNERFYFRVCGGIFDIGFGESNGSGGPAINDGQWHHLAAVCDDTGKKVDAYVDGVYRFSRTSAKAFNTTNWYGCTTDWNGSIQDVRIYSYSLSPQEIKELSRGKVGHWLGEENGTFLKNYLVNIGNTQLWTKFNSKADYTILESSTNNFGLAAGTPYVWSVDVKTSHTSKIAKARVEFYNSSSNRTGSTGNNYVTGVSEGRIWVAGTILSGYSKMRLTVDFNSGSDITTTNYDTWYKNPKLEIGTIPSIYYPSSSSAFLSDISGFGRHMDVKGNISLSVDTKRYDKSLKFDGASYMETTNSISLSDHICTLSCWIKPSGVEGTTNWIFALSNGTSYLHQIGLYITNTNIVTLIGGGDNGSSTWNWNPAFSTSSWYHIVLVSDGTNLILYINGVSQGSKAINGSNKGTTLLIGQRAGAAGIYRYNGFLSDIRLYATALSADDVKELYALGN